MWLTLLPSIAKSICFTGEAGVAFQTTVPRSVWPGWMLCLIAGEPTGRGAGLSTTGLVATGLLATWPLARAALTTVLEPAALRAVTRTRTLAAENVAGRISDRRVAPGRLRQADPLLLACHW